MSPAWIGAGTAEHSASAQNQTLRFWGVQRTELRYSRRDMSLLKITVERIDGYCNMPMLVGDTFYLDGYRLSIPTGKFVCMWALQSLIPLLPLITERDNLAQNHWIQNVQHILCPDPKGGVHYRVEKVDDDPR